jgi:hypothetical protein
MLCQTVSCYSCNFCEHYARNNCGIQPDMWEQCCKKITATIKKVSTTVT